VAWEDCEVYSGCFLRGWCDGRRDSMSIGLLEDVEVIWDWVD
jgi:hypothetical protein